MDTLPHVSIVICSGFSDEISPDKAHALGTSGYIAKPVLLTDLAQKGARNTGLEHFPKRQLNSGFISTSGSRFSGTGNTCASPSTVDGEPFRPVPFIEEPVY